MNIQKDIFKQLLEILVCDLEHKVTLFESLGINMYTSEYKKGLHEATRLLNWVNKINESKGVKQLRLWDKL